MNPPVVKISTPSPLPALELIALAQLSHDVARKKLRALLLTNPNYFAKIPPTSFSAVLNIQQDTTYESISRLVYDANHDQISAAINVKQVTGYSSEILVRGSEEFIRFYLSYDGGSRWDDLGMRSVTVSDSHRPGTAEYEVTLPITADGNIPERFPPKIRAILSWNTPPPAREPGWKPIWGNVAESDVVREDSQAIDRSRSKMPTYVDRQDVAPDILYAFQPIDFTSDIPRGHLSMRALHSTKTDPHHRFFAFVLARAAGYCSSNSLNPRVEEPYRIPIPLPPPSISTLAGIS